jgi:hypothetical protein
VYRFVGGRGGIADSHVSCYYSTSDSTLCPTHRRTVSGSLQGKVAMVPELVSTGSGSVSTYGVTADRDSNGPDSTNGYKWRVTFLDQASSSKNWAVSIAHNALVRF